MNSRLAKLRLSKTRLLLPARTAIQAAFAVVCLSALTLSTAAQALKTASTPPPPEPSRVDLYGGYGYFNAVNSDVNFHFYQPINLGSVVSATGYFNRFLGVKAEGSFFPHGPNDCVFTAQAGPIFRYQKNRFVPFAHVLGGGAKVGGPVFQPCTWGWGITGGLGADYILPAFHNRIAIRPIQADFSYSHVDFGPVDIGNVTGGIAKIDAYRLSAGIVLRLGQVAVPPPVQLGCTVQPVNIFAGDPIAVTAVAANLGSNRKVTYTWTTNGGQISGKDENATVSTTGLAPGDYTISGRVSAGIRPGQQANCTAGFRVHRQPPTVACSANPSTVQPNESTTITAAGNSPENHTLTYSYSATAGEISGTTPTATLSTVGAPPGPITVTCNAVDDLGKQATSTTVVTVATPPQPAPPQPVNLCSLSFERDRKRPTRVDNEAKGCLDEIALTLDRDLTSKLVIVGKHSADEPPDAAAQRTLNVQLYLTSEKGIDPSRIELRTGGEFIRVVDSTLVPAGAAYTPGDTVTIDATSIKQEGQPYGMPKAPQKAHKPKS